MMMMMMMIMIIIIIIIIFINCNLVVTRWQWLFYRYTKYEASLPLLLSLPSGIELDLSRIRQLTSTVLIDQVLKTMPQARLTQSRNTHS